MIAQSCDEILDLESGTLKIEIQAINYLGFGGKVVTETFPLEGKTRIPENVTNLRFEDVSPNLGRLTWDKTTALDVKVGGKVHIRQTNVTGANGTWSNSTDLIAAIPGHSTEALIPKMTGNVLVKFADDGNRFSDSAAVVAITESAQKSARLLVKNQREDTLSPPFPGTKTNTEYDASTDVLRLTLNSGNVNSSGSYSFNPISNSNPASFDLEGVFAIDIQRYMASTGSFLSDLMDSWNDVNAREDWDGGEVGNVNAQIDIYTTNDNPASSPTWSGPITLTNGTFVGRAFKFQANLTSGDVEQNISVENLGYIAHMDHRTEHSNGVAASDPDGSGNAKTIQFSKAFWTGTTALGGSTTTYLPSVSISVSGLATGDYVDMGTVTGSQFTFSIKNSSGAIINKNFTWSAVGYGRAV